MMFLVDGQWVPITDGLPPRLDGKDVSEAVLVTLTNPTRVSMLRYDYEEEYWTDGYFPVRGEVTAWAFAPDPYQPELDGAFFIQGPLIPDED